MKIIELKSSNIKRLKAIELQIDENQNLIMITGKNGQGKSSVLDSIWYALGGKKAVQDKPIRDGEEKGEIELTIKGDKGNYVVKRSFTDKGSYLSVTNSDGAKYSNPQELLDFIVGNLSFDPLEFSRMDAKRQVAELTKIVGLDFSDLEQEKKKLTEERLFVGREEKALPVHEESLINQASAFTEESEVSVSDLNSKIQKANADRSAYSLAQQFIAEGTAKIKKLEEELELIKANINERQKIADTSENIEALTMELSQADEKNKRIREAKSILEDHSKLQAKRAEYQELSNKIKSLDEEKTKRLAEAKMPIAGLSWEEDKVLFNNIPYLQLSSAEQLKISMAIAMAANPKLRMIQIRDGSLLDKDNLKVISEMTKDQDFQAFVEKVDDSGQVGIVIEEGEIKTINN